MAIDLYSKQWCDPTRHAGYESTKEPTLGSRESRVTNDSDLHDDIFMVCPVEARTVLNVKDV